MNDTYSHLDALVAETFSLWNEEWVGFSWGCYALHHTRRVRALAMSLAREEGADVEIVGLAATLHDLTKRYDGEILCDAAGHRLVGAGGLWRNAYVAPGGENRVTRLYDELGLRGMLHSESGAMLAEPLLREAGVPRADIPRICECIRAHVRVSGHAAGGTSVEADVLYDADTLDANMGLVAFYRHVMIHCHRLFLREGGVDLSRYIESLASWLPSKRRFIERMTTDAGRRRARARQVRIVRVYRALAREAGGESSLPEGGLTSALAYWIEQVCHPDLERDRAYLRRYWLPRQRDGSGAAAFCDDLDAEVAGMA